MAIVYGVVDRSRQSDPGVDLAIVEMEEGSDEARRFNWGTSCAGWFPMETFSSRDTAEKYIAGGLQ